MSGYAAPSSAQDAPRDTGSGVVIEGFPFPASIGDLTRGGTTTYRQSGSGFSVSYQAKAFSWADIYVYDKDLNLAAPAKDELAREMYVVLQAILLAKDLGKYDAVKVDAASVRDNVASARMTVTSRGTNHASFAFLTIAHGKFVKIRFSTTDRKDGQRRAEAFRNAYFQQLRKAVPIIQPKRDPRFI
ncbi:hypothetical protein [Microvirga alba]|uniref:Uncharacterized protein n=1 Tax=Microvirga alba TaxID=2791025 RepID=A0A931BT14_9HYPH|nr:hypothetical protein [Microvirga alba]MBF9234153.1 hypothetical protein [Microvirga alba]